MLQIVGDLFRHAAWADAAHLGAIEGHETSRSDAELLQRLGHIREALWAYLAFLTDRPEEEYAPPAAASGGELRHSFQELHERYQGYLESLTEDRLSRRLTYSEPGNPTATVAEVLLQAIMHGQHHRGQNAVRLRRLDVEPPTADYIAWVLTGRPAPPW